MIIHHNFCVALKKDSQSQCEGKKMRVYRLKADYLLIVLIGVSLLFGTIIAQGQEKAGSRKLRRDRESGNSKSVGGDGANSSRSDRSGQPQLVIQLGHSFPVFSVAISADGRYLVTW